MLKIFLFFSITLAAHNLAMNPEIQEKLYHDNQSVIEKMTAETGNPNADPVDLITIDSLHRFEYLNAVINESLRLFPPGVFIERHVGKDMNLATKDGRISFSVKKGDVMHFPVYSLHRLADQFPDPEIFKPERFLENPTYHKYAYIPFGSGPRYSYYLVSKLFLIY